jgi:hypothetical protein
VLIFCGQIREIDFRRLDAGVAQALLQQVDRTAAFQPVNRVQVSQIMKSQE